MIAQHRLGVSCALGRGVPQSDAEAADWNRKAADQGHVDAQYDLGCMYEGGRGVEKSGCEAARWYKQTAEQGHAKATDKLALIRTTGIAS